jgi:hypothetical protein
VGSGSHFDNLKCMASTSMPIYLGHASFVCLVYRQSNGPKCLIASTSRTRELHRCVGYMLVCSRKSLYVTIHVRLQANK